MRNKELFFDGFLKEKVYDVVVDWDFLGTDTKIDQVWSFSVNALAFCEFLPRGLWPRGQIW
jgi:hypothetical protein